MSEGLNRVMLLGNLGADPELRFTQGGQAVLNMRMAMSESYLDKDKVRRERTEWATVTIWGKRAEALAKFLRKGHRVFVEGSLRTTSYDDRDGKKRYKTEVNAQNVIVESSPKGSAEGRGDGAQRDESSGERRGYGAPQGNRREPTPLQPDDFGYDVPGDDRDNLPF